MTYRYEFYERPSEQRPPTAREPAPHHEDTLTGTLLHVLQLALAFLLIVFTVWAMLYGLMITAMATLTAALVFSAQTRGRHLTRVIKLLLLAVLCGVGLAFHQVPLQELQARNAALDTKLRQSGPEGLDLRDSLGIYGLHLMVATTQGLIGQPHAAREGWALCWPGGKKRHRQSDFPMRSPRVRQALVSIIADLERHHPTDNQVELQARKIRWDYRDGVHPELPFTLPVRGPLELGGGAERSGAVWTLFLTATGEVVHPSPSQRQRRTGRGQAPPLFDEGLFWALQQKQWLHPYMGRWSWITSSADPRLEATTEPLYSPQERWLVRALTQARELSDKLNNSE